MRTARAYRLLLLLAMLAPFAFWAWNQRVDEAVDWRWGLIPPIVIAGYAGIEAWHRRLRERRQIALLALLVLGFWTLGLLLNLPDIESAAPAGPGAPTATMTDARIIESMLAGTPAPEGWQLVTLEDE